MAAFDNREFESYKAEAKEKWGKTEAYGEFAQKTKDYSKDRFDAMAEGLDRIFTELAASMKAGNTADSETAQSLVKKLQSYITEHYYTCTKPILMGLGQMYVSDDRFRENIDRHGVGTAQFAAQAIGVYAKQ